MAFPLPLSVFPVHPHPPPSCYGDLLRLFSGCGHRSDLYGFYPDSLEEEGLRWSRGLGSGGGEKRRYREGSP